MERVATTIFSARRPAPAVFAAVREARISRSVYAATVVWAIGFAAAAAVRHWLFLQRRYDLGNMTQAVSATAHGHFLEVTEAGGAQVSRLGIHVDPIIALFAPLWWLWPSPVVLLVVQAIALAAGAAPLFWFARKHLPSEKDAALVAGAYLLAPSVGWNAIVEFHPVALAVPLLIFSIWFLDEDRFWPFAAAAGAAMLCQEQVGLIVACLGLWHAWHKRRLVPGIAIASVGLLVSALDFGVILRHFSGGSPYSGRYAAVGGSVTGILQNLFTHPAVFVHGVQAWDLLGLLLVLPVLGICFGSGLTLVAAPQVAMLLLSDRTGDWYFAAQNVLTIIPFVYAGTVLALARFARVSEGRRPRVVAGHVLAASIAMAVTLGPFNPVGKHLPSSSRLAAERHAVSLVPADARVSVTNHLGSHLAARRYLYVFPVVKAADWVVVDSADDNLPDMGYLQHRTGITVGTRDLYRQPQLMRRELKALERSPHWKLAYQSDNVYVFTRKLASAARA
jgi:uncharacterized membrane protein